MIDDKRLDSIDEMTRIHPNGTHAIVAGAAPVGAWMLDSDVLSELISLARLGLWAERHGIPALKLMAEDRDCGGAEGWFGTRADEAVSALPKLVASGPRSLGSLRL